MYNLTNGTALSTINGRHQYFAFPFCACLLKYEVHTYLTFFLFFVQFGIINLDVTQMEAATLCEPEERL